MGAAKEDFYGSMACGMCVEVYAQGVGVGKDPMSGTYKGVIVDSCSDCGKGGPQMSQDNNFIL